MAINFGSGLKLKDACSWLQDGETRRERILDVAERNSVIEGLPPFQEETSQRLKEQLDARAARQTEPAE